MSTHGNQGTPIVPLPQDEQLPVGKIVMVAVVAGVAFALGIIWAVSILYSERGQVHNGGNQAVAVGRAEIGMVDQNMFAREQRAVQMRDDKLARLEGYGWVSRKEQLIHVPITDAMAAIVSGKRPSVGGAQQQAPAPEGTDGGAAEGADGGAPATNP